jgi:hypothetical protein
MLLHRKLVKGEVDLEATDQTTARISVRTSDESTVFKLGTGLLYRQWYA